MHKLYLTGTLICSSLLTAGVLEARTWKDATGKYSIEAELVEVTGTSITLRRKDGTTVTVPLKSLSKTDQQYAQEQSKKQPAGPMKNPPKQGQVVGSDSQKNDAGQLPVQPHTVEFQASRKRRVLRVQIHVIGPQAGTALAYGEVAIKTATGKGSQLKRCDFLGRPLDENEPAYSLISRGEPSKIFERSPDDRCIFSLHFKDVEGLTQIDSLNGSVSFVFEDKIDWIGKPAYKTKLIDDPKLKSLGVTPQFHHFPGGAGGAAKVAFPGHPKYAFARLVNGQGKPIETTGGGEYTTDKESGLTWNFNGDLPADTIVQVSCEKPASVVIPFAVQDLSVE